MTDVGIESFESFVRSAVGEAGLGASYAVYRKDCGVVMEALLPDLSPQQVVGRLMALTDVTDYLVAGIDMYSVPGQGLEFDDFVLVAEFDRRRPEPFLESQWRFGVINYRKGDDATKIVRAIDWENPTWSKGAGASMFRRAAPLFWVRLDRGRAEASSRGS
jgi:hypothetical protein